MATSALKFSEYDDVADASFFRSLPPSSGFSFRTLSAALKGLDDPRAKTPFGDLKWVKMPLGARLAHMITHDRRHLWQAEQVRNDPNSPIV